MVVPNQNFYFDNRTEYSVAQAAAKSMIRYEERVPQEDRSVNFGIIAPSSGNKKTRNNGGKRYHQSLVDVINSKILDSGSTYPTASVHEQIKAIQSSISSKQASKMLRSISELAES